MQLSPAARAMTWALLTVGTASKSKLSRGSCQTKIVWAGA